MSTPQEALIMTCDTLMFIPLIFFCILPVIQKAKQSLPKLIIKVILSVIIMEILIFCIYLISISEITVIINICLCFGGFFWLYQKEFSIDRSHLWFIFVTAGMIGSFGYMIYHISNTFFKTNEIHYLYYDFHALLSQIFFECLLIAILYYPTKKHLAWLVQNFHEENFWRIAWIFPISFIILAKSLIPYDDNQIFTEEAINMYLIFILVLVIIIICLYILFYQVAYQMVEKQKIVAKNNYLEMQSEQYRRLQDHVQETKRIRHDFHHQLIVLERMLKNKEYSAAEEFLDAYRHDIRCHVKNYCESTAINAVLNHYASLCCEMKITILFNIRLEETGALKDIDICVLLSNLLENAVYGCNDVDNAEKKIELTIGQTTKNIIVLKIANSYVGNIKRDGDAFLSSRHSGEGQGMKSVRLITEKYNGFLKVRYDGQNFIVNVLLNI